jgi:heptosyltransferase-2
LVAGFFPGAARGPAKRWPSEAFVDLGRRLLASQACRILVLGGRQDRAVCGQVAEGIGRGAVNTAGETPLALLAGFLRLCRVVVANDSGGMHLAAAVGARVVGLFGATDPSKTAPLGAGHRVIAARGVAHSRAVPRDADWARKAMASITVDEVYTAAVDVLEDWRPLSARQASGRAPPQG